MAESKKQVAALLSDLMFLAKIQEAAKRVAVDVVFMNSEEEAIRQAKENPSLMILDLNNAKLDALSVIEKLKSDPETSKTRLLGFVSHVQTELKRAAEEKGCDSVIARSAFSRNLAAILRDYAGTDDQREERLGVL
ncbi:MAG: hypothetical protein JO097_17605 [Acidobacteriaceae bacterium]|nr:hypothetical protein [Acidobacteriaceae bacterium]MBV9295679.1 hypothetical protein [Acidobacteriaceae bacterium]MBV9765483.1 hypothetical protein [Acidobacteriaceae bacterium]